MKSKRHQFNLFFVSLLVFLMASTSIQAYNQRDYQAESSDDLYYYLNNQFSCPEANAMIMREEQSTYDENDDHRFDDFSNGDNTGADTNLDPDNADDYSDEGF